MMSGNDSGQGQRSRVMNFRYLACCGAQAGKVSKSMPMQVQPRNRLDQSKEATGRSRGWALPVINVD